METHNFLSKITLLQSRCYFLALEERSLVVYSLSRTAKEGQDNDITISGEQTERPKSWVQPLQRQLPLLLFVYLTTCDYRSHWSSERAGIRMLSDATPDRIVRLIQWGVSAIQLWANGINLLYMIVICKLDIIFFLWILTIYCYILYTCNILFFYCKAHLKTAKLNLRGTNKCLLQINVYYHQQFPNSLANDRKGTITICVEIRCLE